MGSERVAAIAERYGVTVLIGDAACMNISTHTAETVSVEQALPQIDTVMNVIEEVLAAYPPNFFQSIAKSDGDELIVELCGTIRAKDEYALDFPSALTFQGDGCRVIVLDVYYASGLRYTLFHEIAHVIDRALDATVTEYDDPRWNVSDWNALNPKKFSYYYAYNDQKGNPYDVVGSTKYTAQSSDYLKKHKSKSVYFANVYAKTYPTEDRAVLMGLLLADDTSDDILSCPHIKAKLVYYAKAIRAVLDPDGTLWPEPTVWETRIAELK